MTKAVMSVMKNTPKVWFGFIFFRPDSGTNQKNLSIYSYILVLTNILGSPVLVLSNAFPPRVSQQVTLIQFVDRAWSKA